MMIILIYILHALPVLIVNMNLGKKGVHFIPLNLLKKSLSGIETTEKQLRYKDIYEEMHNDPGPLISTIHKAIEKIISERPKVYTLLLAPKNN